MDKHAFPVIFALVLVVGIGGTWTLRELWRRRTRAAELQHQQAEPVGLLPQMPDGSAATPGEAIRYLLYEIAPGFKTRVVAIDIGQDAIWVRQSYVRTTFRVPRFDPENSALMASAWRAEVTAAPAVCPTRTDEWVVLILCVPGQQPLTIGCREDVGSQWNAQHDDVKLGRSRSATRLSWRGNVSEVNTPAYWAPGQDWVALVEKFGLVPYLDAR